MKLHFLFLSLLFLLPEADPQTFTIGDALQRGRHLGPACVGLPSVLSLLEHACKRRKDKALWSEIAKCHKPMNETFMRSAAEAQCPYPYYGKDPNDLNIPLEEIFYNTCGVLKFAFSTIQMTACFVFGDKKRNVPAVVTRIKEVESEWHKDFACEIGQCISKLNLQAKREDSTIGKIKLF